MDVTESDIRPGTTESDAFPVVLPSVQHWKTWQPPNVPSQKATGDSNEVLVASLANLRDSAGAALRNGRASSSRGGKAASDASAYWAYHAARLSFFAGQNVLALALSTARMQSSAKSKEAGGLQGSDDDEKEAKSMFLFESGGLVPVVAALGNLVSESVATWEQDHANIVRGDYAVPWDMDMGLSHRQAQPSFVLDKGRRLFQETFSILSRKATATAEDRTVWMGGANTAASPTYRDTATSTHPASFYPDYYQTNFHYQTDGWLSQDSASVYETATESLFLGRQDAMQRGALVPVASWADEWVSSSGSSNARSTGGLGVRMLEVACGTGRFATFLRDNYPHADLTVTDLSPFYLEQARENLAYWEAARGDEARKRVRTKPYPAHTGNSQVVFEQAKAERLPFEPGSFDAVLCVYLFHELPPNVRREAAREFARVLSPGGLLVFTDSVQRGDRFPGYDARLDRFEDLNEPFYTSYVREDLVGIFKEAGLAPDLKSVTSVSKTLSFRKPRTEHTAAVPQANASLPEKEPAAASNGA